MPVLIVNGVGSLCQNSGQRFLLEGQAGKADVHLPNIEVGEDAAVPVEVATYLVPDANIEPYDGSRGDDLGYGVGRLNIRQALLVDMLGAPGI